LLTNESGHVLEEGAQITASAYSSPPVKMIGHVTSAYWSETLQRSIAMAVVEGGRARMGAKLYVPMPDGVHPVRVVEPVFYDLEGGRLDG
jgi:sarcosine oxidase subunit alpha